MHKKAVTKQPNSRSTACSSFFGGTQVIWQRNSVPGDVSRHFDGLSSFIIIIFALKWPWHDDGIPWYTPFSDTDIQLQSTHTYPELWTNNAFIYVSSTSGAHHGTEPLIHTTVSSRLAAWLAPTCALRVFLRAPLSKSNLKKPVHPQRRKFGFGSVPDIACRFPIASHFWVDCMNMDESQYPAITQLLTIHPNFKDDHIQDDPVSIRLSPSSPAWERTRGVPVEFAPWKQDLEEKQRGHFKSREISPMKMGI